MLLRYGPRRCYFSFITLLHYYRTGQDITLFVIRCYAIAGDAIIFFVICYYVVTLLPAVLLFSSLYYRHCFYFLSFHGFKFRAWIIFFLVIRLDDFKKNNTEHSRIQRENERNEIGKERTVKL